MSDASPPISPGLAEGLLVGREEYTGLIAFFDILGFSEMIKENKFSGKMERYKIILNDAVNKTDSDLEYVFFSDSVLINSKSSSKKALLEIILAVSEINYRLVTELSLTICGCISYGTFTKYTDDKKNVMITGLPIVDASHYEKEQNWCGVMISPRVLAEYPIFKEIIIPDLSQPENIDIMVEKILWLLSIKKYDNIPFTNNRCYQGYIIIPKDIDSKNVPSFLQSLKRYRTDLLELCLLAPDSYTQKKYQEFIKMISVVETEWKDIPQDAITQPLFED